VDVENKDDEAIENCLGEMRLRRIARNAGLASIFPSAKMG